MKSLLAIPLLIIYLLGNTELGQLVNLPELIQHYQEDHYRDHKIDFIKFLVMHYCSDDGTSADDNADNKLPFKQAHGAGFFLGEVPGRTISFIAAEQYETCCLNGLTPRYFIEKIYLTIPLQPPRLLMA